MKETVAELGYIDATPIQAAAIPVVLQGGDIIGQAQTGTGKTAAFGIPMIESIDGDEKSIIGLVLCPTRELCLQVSRELKKFSSAKRGMAVVAIYGGESIQKQINSLKRPVQIIVGTPGRVIDMLDRKVLNFSKVKMVVLDEADEMLNMGFVEDIELILSSAPKERQTLLFSATMPAPILKISKKYQKDAQIISVTSKQQSLTNASIEQEYFPIKETSKMQLMTLLMELHKPDLSLVFCNTRKKVDEITSELKSLGLRAEGLHGDMRQMQRNTVMDMYRSGRTKILVATDVAARGLDVENVDAVFNYDIPNDPEIYVHRIGRTGRAGKTGRAFSFIMSRDKRSLSEIEKYARFTIKQGEMPSWEAMLEHNKHKLFSKIKETVAHSELELYDALSHEIMEKGITLHQLAAALLKMNLEVGRPANFPTADTSSDRSSGRERGRERDGGRGRDGGRDRESGRDRDGGRDRSRGRDRESSGFESNENMSKLFLSIGKNQRVNPGDILGALAQEYGISGKSIGYIELKDKFSLVEVAESALKKILKSSDRIKIKGENVRVKLDEKY